MKNGPKEVVQTVVGVNIQVGNTRLCLEVRDGAVPAYVVEMELLERMPKQLRDTINNMSMGLSFETLVSIYTLWESCGLQRALQTLEAMNSTAKQYYVTKGLELK